MSQDPIFDLLDSARQVGLLSNNDVSRLDSQLRSSGVTTRQEVAAKLVEKKVLSDFQIEQLLAGRGQQCVLANRYFIRQQLGAGAMGTVYLADDKKLDRSVAIKVLPAHSVADSGAVARFRREAKALAKLCHQNVIQAYDADQDADRQFLVMEYARGTSLVELLNRQGRLAPAFAADIAYQVALGLQHAHEQGLIHRDLKPGNLLLTLNGQVKILDLGLARFMQDHMGDAALTHDGTGVGTPDYMAPEQFYNARHADARSDIYSLGCTLYHFIAGRVPFPGSSLSEKFAAHKDHEATPLEEVRPDVPAGLALAVRHMMAKRPDDRFQSAREVAEALFPHVSGSSAAIQQITSTATWQGSQLGISVRPTRSRAKWQRATPIVVGIALLLLATLFGARNYIWPPVDLTEGDRSGGRALGLEGENGPRNRKVDASSKVVTVAQTENADFRTISAALENAKPGMRIEVLDKSTYRESLFINNAESHTDITLEAKAGATIEWTADNTDAILVSNVSGVTIRGFQLIVSGQKSNGVRLSGTSPGVHIQKLTIDCRSKAFGVNVINLLLDAGDAPAIIEDCVIGSAVIGVDVFALAPDYHNPQSIRRVVVLNNTIVQPTAVGINVRGAASNVLIAGNRILRAGYAGLQLEQLQESTDNVLIANNTTIACRTGFRVWSDAEASLGSKNIELANNLFLASESPDLGFVDSGGSQESSRGYGDGTIVQESWDFHHNWRELGSVDKEQKGWIPPSDDDKMQMPIAVSSRVPSDTDFLRPALASPLATAGAGSSDNSLPLYVGAVAPVGVAAWDWTQTWDARQKTLLTVSQKEEDGGEFRSIGEAVEKVTHPGTTIRVLDNANYEEFIELTKPWSQKRLTLEAPQKATIVAPRAKRACLVIRNLPNVTVRGFGFESSTPDGFLVVVEESCPGVVIEEIECRQGSAAGIHVENLGISAGDKPLEIRNCSFTNVRNGIVLLGRDMDSARPLPIRNVIVRGNRITDCEVHGIGLTGRLNNVAVIENRIARCSGTNIYMQGILSGSKDILIANNTLQNSGECFQISEPMDEPNDVKIVNNLLMSESDLDLTYFGDKPEIVAAFRVANNYRRQPTKLIDGSRHLLSVMNDRVAEKVAFLSLDLHDPNFLLSVSSTNLEIESIDGLPDYIGAVPQDASKLWNWTQVLKTFRAAGESEGD